jgi:hypothetical protein
VANLITNGTFDTDVSGWTAASNPPTSISHVSPANRMKVQSDGDANGIGLQAVNLSLGEDYNLSFDGFEVDGDSWGYIIANSDQSIEYEDTSFTGNQSVSFDFEATDTTMIVGLVNVPDNDGTSTDFDNVVVDLAAENAEFESSPGVLTLTGLPADVSITLTIPFEASPGALTLTGELATVELTGLLPTVEKFLLPPIRRHYVNYEEWQRQITWIINAMLDGKHNGTGSITLTASASSTAVADSRVGTYSVINLMPLTANAAAEIGAGAVYVSSRAQGTFTIAHANNAQTDRLFQYSISGL